MKVVINTKIGGFGLSKAAWLRLKELGHPKALQEEGWCDYEKVGYQSYCYDIDRFDPMLLQVIEELGVEKCSGSHGLLKVVEIPDGIQWDIGYADDGREWVYEKHRTWE